MKKILVVLFAFAFIGTNAQKFPERNTTSYVNDFAGLIDDPSEQMLDIKIREFKEKSSIEMTIVTVKTLDGSDVDSYTNELFRKWGVGKKELNNGIMILMSYTDHKWRIEVGTGLEEYITDGYAKIKGQDLLVPNFKKNNFYAGFNSLLDEFITKLGPISWEQRAELKKKQEAAIIQQAQDDHDSMISFLMWFGIITGAGIVLFLLIRNEVLKKRKIEKEKKDYKEKMDKLIFENNSSINDLQRLVAWANGNKELFSVSDLSNFESASKKVVDLYSKRVLSVEYLEDEKILIKNTVQISIDKIRPLYVKVSEFNALKLSIDVFSINPLSSKVNEVRQRYTSIMNDYGINVVEVAFPETTFLEKLKQAQLALSKIKDTSTKTLYDYAALKKDFNDIQKITKEVSDHLTVIVSRLDIITNAVQYVSTNRGKIVSLIHDAQRIIKNSDVSSSTKTKFHSVKTKAEMFREPANPFNAYNELHSLITDLDTVIKKGKNEIDDAERERRREADRIASIAAAALAASRSRDDDDYRSSSSSSSSSSSDFGGGSSSGGGASGDW